MASLYSVIPGLVPSAQEILEAELLAKQVLEGKFPDLDLREGTGLRDLVLRPTAYAFALLQKAGDYYFVQNTLQGVNNATPEETVDDILSNWFLQRNTGTYAVISARLYFARQKNVTITTDISFSPNNSLQYFPESSSVYPSNAMTYDSYSNEWYIDVALRAASTGSVYNIGEGSLLYFTNFDPYFLRAEINYLIEESTASETNSEFISRAESAISTRNLINIPSTESRLRETFSYLNKVTTVGAGDPDMIRDMIKVHFDKAPSLDVNSVAINGDTVTLYVNTNSFIRDQEVDLSGAIPDIFNGRYSILDIGVGTISISVPGNPGFISVVPKLSVALSPLFIHNGGMTDVYCGSRISSSIVQLTTDSRGVASIVGPVYRVVRSEISGGDSDDTIPLVAHAVISNPYTTTSGPYAMSVDSGIVTVYAYNHGVSLGRRVTIKNSPINAINGSWLVVDTSTENQFQVYVGPLSTSPLTITSGEVTYVDQRNDNGFSTRQVLDADFGSLYANSTVSFELGAFSDLLGVQDYLESPANRVLCGDYLARGFNLHMLDISVTSYSGLIPSTALIQSTLNSYLASLPTGATLIVSEFVRVLGDVGITNIKTPVGVTYSRYTRDLTPVETGTVTDYLDPNDKTNIFLLRSVSSDSENV